MALIAKTFDECGFEKELIDYLNSIGFKQPIGLQQQLIPLMVQQNYDIILSGGIRSGKTIGYLLPIINQVIKKQKQNNYSTFERVPTGIILMSRPSLIQSVTQQANNLCQGLNICIMSGNKKNLAINSAHGVDIIITKVEILRKCIFSFGSSVSNINYIVVDQANLFSKGEGKYALKEIYNCIQQFGNTEITSVFSSTDFRNEERNLAYYFFGDNVKIINTIQGPIIRRNLNDHSLPFNNQPHFPQMHHSNVAKNFNNEITKKMIYSIPREYISIHILDSFKIVLKIVNEILKENPSLNIVIFTRTSHIGQYLNYLLTQINKKTYYITESTNYSYLNSNSKNLIMTGITFIVGDDVQFTLNCVIKNIVAIHQRTPPSKLIFEKRISMFINNSTQIIKSIILDSKEKLVDFINCIT